MAPLSAQLFEGLNPLKDKVFPKRCAKCGTVYESLTDFISRTDDLPNSTGLQYFGEGQNSTALYRNCACQSTLIVLCNNRRDETERGIKRREIFEELYRMLLQVKPDAQYCREQLLKLLNP